MFFVVLHGVITPVAALRARIVIIGSRFFVRHYSQSGHKIRTHHTPHVQPARQLRDVIVAATAKA
jgi:hypothetical protein